MVSIFNACPCAGKIQTSISTVVGPWSSGARTAANDERIVMLQNIEECCLSAYIRHSPWKEVEWQYYQHRRCSQNWCAQRFPSQSNPLKGRGQGGSILGYRLGFFSPAKSVRALSRKSLWAYCWTLLVTPDPSTLTHLAGEKKLYDTGKSAWCIK